MTHWTLFTLRMIARVGLVTSLPLWWYAQSNTFLVITPTSPGYVAVSMLPRGIAFCHSRRPVTFGFGYGVLEYTEAAAAEAAFESGYQQLAPDLPGLSFYTNGAAIPETTVVTHHWLLCLTFLCATIATSMRWKKKPVESGQEQADEQSSGQDRRDTAQQAATESTD